MTSQLALVAALVAGAACDAPDVASRTQAIIGGTPAPGDVAVVGLAYRESGCGQERSYIDCTGTLVAPRVVVTAAHCLGFDPPNVHEIFFGASFADGGVSIPVAGGRAHPDYDAATHANDIAALILATDAPGAIAPIPLHATPLPDLTGSAVRMVGFGVTSLTATETGVRMSGTGRVTAVGTDDVSMAPDPGMSCHGDSGGPVLADLGSGEELVGVTAYGDPACAQLGVAIRADRQLAFLQPILDEAAAAPARRPFDPSEHFCATTCEVDADCPDETVCFSLDGAPRHCTYRGLPAGDLGKPCTAAGGDPSACVTIPDGTCRTYTPCDSQSPAASGCGIARSNADLVAVGWIALALATGRRRRAR